MYLASAVSLRSSDENRQVGAAIVDIFWEGPVNDPNSIRNEDIRALGMNEVPRAGGGFYWDEQSPDKRDQALLPEDRAQDIKLGLLTELLGQIRAQKWLGPEAGNGDDSELARKLLPHLAGSQFMDISEFSRPVHAEMAAIIDAARRGVSIDGCSMYVTTFPCHNCAEHIIAAGIRRVVYLEPYPKSRADNLYREELDCDSLSGGEYKGKVLFLAYSGVAPRQYSKLFSMGLRGGKIWSWPLKAGRDTEIAAADLRRRSPPTRLRPCRAQRFGASSGQRVQLGARAIVSGRPKGVDRSLLGWPRTRVKRTKKWQF